MGRREVDLSCRPGDTVHHVRHGHDALAGCFVEIDAAKMMVEILKVVIVPMLADWNGEGPYSRW